MPAAPQIQATVPLANYQTVPLAAPQANAPRLQVRRQSSAEDHADLRNLLNQRLRLICTVMVIVSGIELLVATLTWLDRGGGSLAQLLADPWVPFNSLHATIYLLAGWFLRRHRQLSVAQLRAVEFLVYATLVLFNAAASWLVANRLLQMQVSPGGAMRAAMAGTLLVIVSYGTLIPNEARRCSWAVGLIATITLTVAALALLNNSITGLAMLRGLFSLSVQLIIAVCIAIAGAHRLETLRRESSLARRLGQYQLKQRLGAGGMGEVYLAEHLLLRRPCAIKLIKPEHGTDTQSLLRFEREVRATATLSHPNTVQIFDYGHGEDGTFYYAMEFLPGLNLQQLVERHGAMPAGRVVHVLRQLCGSLHEAHSIGLIHRDIKPGNVMLTSRGALHDVVKLLDFGLVMHREAAPTDDRLTLEGGIAGTPAFMSPEQAAGKAELDARSDIYSVGCLAYFLLAGRTLFAGRSVMAVLAAQMYEQPEPLDQLDPPPPPALRLLVERCLAKAPEQRFPSVASLDRALAESLPGPTWTEADAAGWWRGRETSASPTAAPAGAG